MAFLDVGTPSSIGSDVSKNAEAVGMLLNSKKTTLIAFNNTQNRQCIQCVDRMCLLGIVFDDCLSWWPFVDDVKARHTCQDLVTCKTQGSRCNY